MPTVQGAAATCTPPARFFSDPVIKTLYALSGNRCAFGACDEQLTDPTWESVNADIAHIVGLRHGSARHVCGFEGVNAFPNLLLLCKNHHHRVDRLEPSRYSIEDLRAMKARAEERAEEWQSWTSDEQLDRYVSLTVRMISLANEPNLEAMDPPALRLVRRGSDLLVVNVGQLAAFQWTIDPRNDMETFERGVSFELMQSWEHNEDGPIAGHEERQVGIVTDDRALAQHPETVILRWSNSMGEPFSSFEQVTSDD